MINLKEFQSKAKGQLLDLLNNRKNNEPIVMQSPTGSGKTIILCSMVQEYLKDTKNKTVFVWFTPGAGELEEQSKEKFEDLVPEYDTKTLDDAVLNLGSI